MSIGAAISTGATSIHQVARSCGWMPDATRATSTMARPASFISWPDDLLAAIAVEEPQRARRAVGAELHVRAAAVADEAHPGAFLGRGELHRRPASRVDQPQNRRLGVLVHH